MEFKLEFQWIKDDDNNLSVDFVSLLKDRFKIDWFIETGTYRGDTASAMSKVFQFVDTVELDESLFSKAKERFDGVPNINVYTGESTAFLQSVLSDNRSGLVWLDAHFSGEGTAKGKEGNSPLISEMRKIMSSPCYNSLIVMIDDFRYFVPDEDVLIKHEAIGGYPLASEFCQWIGNYYKYFVLGDVLTMFPNPTLANEVEGSEFLKAYTNFRCIDGIFWEKELFLAKERELLELESIPRYLAGQLNYGLGFHYYAARALKRHLSSVLKDQQDMAFVEKLKSRL